MSSSFPYLSHPPPNPHPRGQGWLAEQVRDQCQIAVTCWPTRYILAGLLHPNLWASSSPLATSPATSGTHVHYSKLARWAILSALNICFRVVLLSARQLPTLGLTSERSILKRLPLPFLNWGKQCKLASHLVAANESAQKEIVLAQALLIPWAGCVWYRVSDGKGVGVFSGTTLRGEQCHAC